MLPASILTVAQASSERLPLDLPSRTAEQAGQSGGSIVRTLIALAVVAALIYAVAWAVRRSRGIATPVKAGRGAGPLVAEATLSLAPNRSVHVVRAGRQVLVLGTAEHGVTRLGAYSEEEALGLGLIEPEPDAPAAVPTLPDLRAGRTLVLGRLRDLTVRS